MSKQDWRSLAPPASSLTGKEPHTERSPKVQQMYTQSTRYTKQSPQSPKYTEWSLGVTKSIRKVYCSIRFLGIFDSYIISFQPSAFPLPYLWHAHRPNITLPEKFPTLFPSSHLFAFLKFLTGPNIPYQRSEIHRATDGSGRQWQCVTGSLERKSSVIFTLCIYIVCQNVVPRVFYFTK